MKKVPGEAGDVYTYAATIIARASPTIIPTFHTVDYLCIVYNICIIKKMWCQ